MGRAEQYRYLEADVRARASKETDPALRNGWENLAESYARLAQGSEASSASSVSYDPLKRDRALKKNQP